MTGQAAAHRPTDVARAYRSFLTRAEGDDLDGVREQGNPYKREHLRAAWEAGWLAAGRWPAQAPDRVAEGLPKSCRAAFKRGHQARQGLAITTNSRR